MLYNNLKTEWCTRKYEKPTPYDLLKREAIPLCETITALTRIECPTKDVEHDIEKYTKRLLKIIKRENNEKDGCYTLPFCSVILYPTGMLRIGDTILFTDPNHKILDIDEIHEKAVITEQADVAKPFKSHRWRPSGPQTTKITPKRVGMALRYANSSSINIMYPILIHAMNLENSKQFNNYYRDELQNSENDTSINRLKNYTTEVVFKLCKLQESYELPVETFENDPSIKDYDTNVFITGKSAAYIYMTTMALWIRRLYKVFAPIEDKNCEQKREFKLYIPTKEYIENIKDTADALNLKETATWATSYNWRGDKNKSPLISFLEYECNKPSYDVIDITAYESVIKCVINDYYKHTAGNSPEIVSQLKKCINEVTKQLHEICTRNPYIREMLSQADIYDGTWEADFETDCIFKGDDEPHEITSDDIYIVYDEKPEAFHNYTPEQITEDESMLQDIQEKYREKLDQTYCMRHLLNTSVLRTVIDDMTYYIL